MYTTPISIMNESLRVKQWSLSLQTVHKAYGVREGEENAVVFPRFLLNLRKSCEVQGITTKILQGKRENHNQQENVL